jgi:hypothetical protein
MTKTTWTQLCVAIMTAFLATFVGASLAGKNVSDSFTTATLSSVVWLSLWGVTRPLQK